MEKPTTKLGAQDRASDEKGALSIARRRKR